MARSIVVSARKLQGSLDWRPRRFGTEKQRAFGIGSLDSFDCFSSNGCLYLLFTNFVCICWFVVQKRNILISRVFENEHEVI